ncbi:restriction endonuclease subunit S [Thalassolituus oleivorans]|uniref:restriction endonuclease subunit S n=1 Tax=Thalassolituus oleivorans TaxID=187493 RepID=UPI0009FA62F9|nr:restriction endonuclease subunit S [Thalassolituus oleivorans]
MTFDWTTLGEYARVQGGYAYKSNDFTESGVCPVLKIKNVRVCTVDYSETSFISEEIANDTFEWRTKEGDILISMTGSGPNAPQSLVGRVARVWGDEPEAWINQRVGRLVLNQEDLIHPDFLFYILSSQSSQDFLVSNSSGSANQANISGKTIESLPCPKIEYNLSANIAKTLRNFDQKIILNRQINQTLESMAQAIFQSWFVDFDPVKAKIAASEQWQILTDDERTEWLNELLDRQDYFKTCLLELTAKAGLNDDENLQLDSSLDFISCRGQGPEGSESLGIGFNNLRKEWQSKKVGPALQSASETLYLNIAAMTAISSRNETSLADMSTDEFAQLYKTASIFPERLVESELGEIPEGWRFDELRKIAHFSAERIDLSELTLESYVSTENMLENKKGITIASSLPTVKTVPKFEPGQILISNIRPYFMKIWLASFVGGRSNDVLGINSKEPEGIQYLYNLLYQDRFFNFMMTTSKGAKMPRGDKEAIMSWICVQPTFDIKSAYSEIVEKFVEIIVNKKKENGNLENARDTLLPKLLSGELDVSSLTELSGIEPAAMDV